MKFIINKNVDNEIIFNIKKNGGIDGLVIEPSDTFVFKLIAPKTNTVVLTVNATVVDAANGKIKVSIPSSATTGLEISIGDRCDYYKRKAMYHARIECTTVNQGKFAPKLDKVYVE